MKFAIGSVQFGLEYGVANKLGRVNESEAIEILRVAKNHGIDMLDTAIAYGDSEAVLGRLGVSDWNVITKLPGIPENCSDVADWVADQIDQSMKRLGVSVLYGVMLHRPSQLLQYEGEKLYVALEKLKTNGLTKKIGVSIYKPDELNLLLDRYDFDIVQSPLNVWDRRIVSSGWAARLKQAGIELHTRSAFLQGLLLIPEPQRPEKFKRWSALWSRWDSWLAESHISSLQACLYYLNSIPEVDRVVVGIDSAHHIHQVLEAENGVLNYPPDFFKDDDDERILDPSVWNDFN